MSRPVSLVLGAIAITLFLALAWVGVTGAFRQFSTTNTTGQQLQSASQLTYGILSAVSVAAWFWARRWSRPSFVGFVLSLALAGGLAPVVWGESTVALGVLSGVASLLIAWGFVWLLRFSAHGGA
jgi:hypothetical protein